MNRIYKTLAASAIVLVIFMSGGCSNINESTITDASEESNIELALDEQYDNVRNGARLILNLRRRKQYLQGDGRKHHRRNFEASPR